MRKSTKASDKQWRHEVGIRGEEGESDPEEKNRTRRGKGGTWHKNAKYTTRDVLRRRAPDVDASREELTSEKKAGSGSGGGQRSWRGGMTVQPKRQ